MTTEKETARKIIDEQNETERRHLIISQHGLIRVTNYVDNVTLFWDIQPFFYDKSGQFWIWDLKDKFWYRVDEIDIMNAIDKELYLIGETVTSGIRNGYLEAFRRVGRNKMPKIPSKKWVQFQDEVINIDTKEIKPADPSYFYCNPIPHKIGISDETPVMDRLFKEWVGEEYIQTIYEIIAYCCYTDYPIQVAITFIGSGRNGKTKLQNLIRIFLGQDNLTSIEFDELVSSNFGTYTLYKKLVCMMGETNFGVLEKTSIFKKLIGQDLINYQAKFRQSFTGINYAKIIISSNSLPISEDQSEGFYRRWLIIDFPNEFPEGCDVLEQIPTIEYNNLARKIIPVLNELLQRGSFTNQGTLLQRKSRYIMASNPLVFFISQCCDTGEQLYDRDTKVYNAYIKFLKENKRRIVSRKEFFRAITEAGYECRRTTKRVEMALPERYESGTFIFGMKIKENFMHFMSIIQNFSINSLYMSINREKVYNEHNSHKSNSQENSNKKEEKIACSQCLLKLKPHELIEGLCEMCLK